MKTSRPPSTPAAHGHGHGSSHGRSFSNTSQQAFRPSKSSSTPAASPHFPHSVGQPYAPKHTPSTANRLTPTARDVHARSPSPNYFGLVVEPSADLRESAMLPTENWSPPTSSVRSFAGAIPKQLPLDANPEFEAFKRQADANRGRTAGFSLATSSFGVVGCAGSAHTPSAASPAPLRPRPSRSHTHASDMSVAPPVIPRSPVPFQAQSAVLPPPMAHPFSGQSSGLLGDRENKTGDGDHSTRGAPGRQDSDAEASSLHDSAYISSDSKRNSQASPNPPSFFNTPRQDSPAQLEAPIERGSMLSAVEDRHPRLSVTQGRPNPPTPDATTARHHRADTAPVKTDTAAGASGPTLITSTELKEMLQNASEGDLLLLDLRVSTLYATSRIQGALNMCIPTTLLKRATFNLQKLQQTFPSGADQKKFAGWRDTKNLVVYDAFSAEKRDVTSCFNMLKKFTSEGYTGRACILRGGFNSFSQLYPQLLDCTPASKTPGGPVLTLNSGGDIGGSGRPAVAPVIGGVTLPTAEDSQPAAFFGNIRQNMDLADGVGQMDVAVPRGLDARGLPAWLAGVAAATDHGKNVSDKFLAIERKEQARMRKAYTSFRVSASTQPGSNGGGVQIAGIEKGDKNRYSNILPFEHARVHLGGKHEGDCDYINASHITSARSHKRYIATQGPLPATFEDFWGMVWDEDVRVVVMLTAEREGGHMKCHPYWRGNEFGPIRLRALSEKKVSLDIDGHRSSNAAPARSMSIPSPANNPVNSSHPSTPGPPSSTQGQFSAAEQGRRRANTTTTLGPSPTAGFGGSSSTSWFPSMQSQQGQTTGGHPPVVIIRKFAMSHAAYPFAPIREITHLHYPSWPDFGAPAQPSHLLALVELANVMQRSAMPLDVSVALASAGANAASAAAASASPPDKRKSDSGSSPAIGLTSPLLPTWYDEPVSDARARPMLVHCSAGCGRTGTFCAVDSVVDMLKRQRLRAVKRASVDASRERKRKRKLAQRDSDGDVTMAMSNTDDGDPRRAHHAATNEVGGRSSPLAVGSSSNAAGLGIGMGMTPTSSPVPPASPPSAVDYDSASSSTSGGGGDRGSPDSLDTSWMDDDTVDLIASTVEDFRGQRLSMVQTIRQFVLCYETVLEWVWRLQERVAPEMSAPFVAGGGGGPRPSGGGGSGKGASAARARSGSLQTDMPRGG